MKKKTHRKTGKVICRKIIRLAKFVKKNHIFFVNDLVEKVSLAFIRYLVMVASYFFIPVNDE